MKSRIAIFYNDEKQAKSIHAGVSPDNCVVPRGLMIETIVEDNEVITLVNWTKKDPKTFISTIDDLLMSVQIAERIVDAINHL